MTEVTAFTVSDEQGFQGKSRKIGGFRFSVFMSHLALCVALILSLGITRHNAEKERAIQSAAAAAGDAASIVIELIENGVNSLNYDSATSEAAEEVYGGIRNLLFFEARGIPAGNSPAFMISYSREEGEIWRSPLSKSLEERLEGNILKLSSIDEKSTEREEYERLMISLESQESSLRVSRLAKDLQAKYEEIFPKKVSLDNVFFHDREQGQIQILVNIRSIKGARVFLVFRDKDLARDLEGIMNNTIRDASIISGFSAILVFMMTWALARPLSKLNEFAGRSVDRIDPYNIPGASRNDEIGDLSRNMSRLILQVRSQLERLNHVSRKDPLTGLLNRDAFREDAKKLMDFFASEPVKVIVALVDIDNFKNYNFQFGRDSGDALIRDVSMKIRSVFSRNSDVVARFCGEEFILASRVKDEKHARILLEKIKDQVSTMNPGNVLVGPGGKMPRPVSVSIGAVLVDLQNFDRGSGLEEMIFQADQALKNAKENGGAGIIISSGSEKSGSHSKAET